MNTIIKSLFILLLPATAMGYTLLHSVDCEDISFADHFLEDDYGSDVSTNWNDYFKAKIFQTSTNPHGGTYCMYHQPRVAPTNPYALLGKGDVTYGNLSNWDITQETARRWYFRWYQKWESGKTYTGYNKMIYIGYQNYGGAGVFVVEKGNNATSWHLIIRDGATYDALTGSNDWSAHDSVDDDQWHLMEAYVDWGTTGGGNGELYFKIDGTTIFSVTSITWTATIPVHPVPYLGLPSNSSDTPSGDQITWLDDISIYSVDSITDIPPEDGDPAPAPPTLSNVTISGGSFR